MCFRVRPSSGERRSPEDGLDTEKRVILRARDCRQDGGHRFPCSGGCVGKDLGAGFGGRE
jgi:hypothetical protein